MRPWTRIFPLFASVCGVLSAQPSAQPTGKQFYTVEKEVALGRQLAEDIRKRTTPVENVDVQEYADRIGKRLSVQIKSPFSLRFEVVAGLPGNPTNEPPELPGGFLFIPADLVLAAHDEDEFAGVLAHAIAHVVNRDTTRVALSGKLASYGTIPLVFVGGWQNGLAIPQGFVKNARIYDADADVAAVGMMRKAGYDPQALVRYIARVQPETISRQSPFSQRDTRIAALESAIQTLGGNDFVKMQQNVREQVGDPPPRKVPSLFR